ncbi:hypothetical protein ACFS07_25085 [Undibacterium arcticum]
MAQTKLVGNMEEDASGSFGNSSKRANLNNPTTLDMIDTGSSGHGTYYMAGLAYWAHTNDIRFDKPVRVNTFSIDVDEGGDGKKLIAIHAPLVRENRLIACRKLLIRIRKKTSTKPRNSQLYLAAKIRRLPRSQQGWQSVQDHRGQ